MSHPRRRAGKRAGLEASEQRGRPPEAARGLSRRRFVSLSAAGTAAFAAWPAEGFPGILRSHPHRAPFRHGVASGDPLPDRVVLWTRVTPSEEAQPGSGLGRPAEVRWEVARDPWFRHVVARGEEVTSARRDHTVKVDAGGLRPATTYFYRFLHGGKSSPVGRTKTAPWWHAPVRSLRFGLASCSNFEGGYFSAYRHMAAREDLDFVLHVGDYFYEYGNGEYGPGPAIGRVHDPGHEAVTLADYRRRHAQHKADPDLQALHGRYAFVCTWDDHEVADDAYADGALNHQPATEGDFATRRANAYRAYFEWMPIRLPEPRRDPHRIYRRLRFGSLADIDLLDLRQYRDQQPADGLDPAKDDPDRVLTGRRQLDWLKESLSETSARWKLIGNSTMIAPVDFRQPLPPGVLESLGLMAGVPFVVDSWDGYTDDRRELLEHIAFEGIDNVAFLTGDIHSSWACDLPLDAGSYPTSPSVAVELVGTSITADNLDEILGLPPRHPIIQQVEQVFVAGNAHIKLLQFDAHGYSVVDVTPERLQMDWHYVSDRTDPNATQAFGQSFQVVAGTNAVQPAAGPLGPR